MNSLAIHLPASKSISNRLLIIQALCTSKFQIENLSKADDTIDLQRCLNDTESEKLNVGEGATTLRFLLAYLALYHKSPILDCGEGLRKRPIHEIIKVLESLHCEFYFIEGDFKLPLKIIKGISEPIPDFLKIDGSLSSQFISSILLIAPFLNKTITIEVTGNLVSATYLSMTIQLMHDFGVQILQDRALITIHKSSYIGKDYFVESDWSAAVFFYALLGLQERGCINFPGLRKSGLQGDEVLITFFEWFGLKTICLEDGIRIEKFNIEIPGSVAFDFTNCPDLFPAMAIFCALNKVNCYFSGLQHLQYKESNRLDIISRFLESQHVRILKPTQEEGIYYFEMDAIQFNLDSSYSSYMDHRIAMAFSLIKWRYPIEIDNSEVVSKSFPNYWDEYRKFEFTFSNQFN
jgi:3-phosphoshikimate 1-carboxyvinyltransferase